MFYYVALSPIEEIKDGIATGICVLRRWRKNQWDADYPQRRWGEKIWENWSVHDITYELYQSARKRGMYVDKPCYLPYTQNFTVVPNFRPTGILGNVQ